MKMRIKKLVFGIICVMLIALCFIAGLCISTSSSVQEERQYQETLMQQANDEVGMPQITEFYEKKLAKEIFELRDDSSLICYAYTRSEMTGKYVFLGRSMGYGLPYSTQYTNPEKTIEGGTSTGGYWGVTIPQADPNGLYSPDGLSATWLWLIDEITGESNISYIEQEILVTQSKLPSRLCESWSLPTDY